MKVVKLVLLGKTCPLCEMVRSCKCFTHVGKMLTLTCNRTYSVIIKNVIKILNIMHTMSNLQHTNIAICTILVLLKRANGFNHYLNIR